ncbi:uncharacterized protein LOC121262111 [Juglans microcarpa x Juglans regia]|uniref:uncharacterized protein LOC121262111 n=1 Tax=Juglans microcarpa x Juglans regia TaxID=2249226 RepID=UPI001B7F1292|nr:uncharacterized protein LOC121262111 [Juglans microcarpa x Juglans regia]
MTNEEDFFKALTREASNIDGAIYRVFRWNTNFKEDREPVYAPVWINLPGLPPNYYLESFLRNIVAPIGQYLKRHNPTRCATQTEGARVCVDMDVSKEPLMAIWVGMPRQPNSFIQEVAYETLPAYCVKCSMQEHNSKTCKWKVENKVVDQIPKMDVKKDHKWVRKEQQKTQEDKENSQDTQVVILHKGKSSRLENFMKDSVKHRGLEKIHVEDMNVLLKEIEVIDGEDTPMKKKLRDVQDMQNSEMGD